MKKIFLILVVSFILIGCQKKPNTPESVVSVPTEPPKDIITTIKDAVQKQLVLRCEYTDEDGEKTMTYIKGGVVRLIGQDADNKELNGLMKDGKFYLWSNESKQGMIININEKADLSMGDTPIESVEDVIEVLESQKDKCSISPESAGLLDLPSDVEFSEAGGFFGDSQEQE